MSYWKVPEGDVEDVRAAVKEKFPDFSWRMREEIRVGMVMVIDDEYGLEEVDYADYEQA